MLLGHARRHRGAKVRHGITGRQYCGPYRGHIVFVGIRDYFVYTRDPSRISQMDWVDHGIDGCHKYRLFNDQRRRQTYPSIVLVVEREFDDIAIIHVRVVDVRIAQMNSPYVFFN